MPRDAVSVLILRGKCADEALNLEWAAFVAQQSPASSWQYDPTAIRLFVGPHTPNRQLYCLQLKVHDRLACVAAFQVFPRPLRFSLGSLNSFGIKGRFAVPFGPLAVWDRDADVEMLLPYLFCGLKKLALEYDLMGIAHLDRVSPIWEYARGHALQHGLTVVRSSAAVNRRYRMTLNQTSFDEFCASLGRKTRQVLRRRSRQVFQTGRPAGKFVSVTEAAQVPMFLCGVDRIFRDTWQCELNGYRQRDTSADVAKFSHLATAGLLRSYLLYYENQPIAYQFGYQHGNTFWADEFGFSKHFARLSPGSALMFRWLEDLFALRKPLYVDLGDTDSGQKSMFRAEPIDVISVAIAGQTWWRWFLRGQQILTGTEALLRRQLQKYRQHSHNQEDGTP